MKRILAFAVICVCLFAFAIPQVMAAEELLTVKVSSVVQAKDKNGNAYTRAIIEEQKELSGVKYTTGTPLMFFGDMASKGLALKAGQTVKVIASKRIYNENVSYTAHAIVQ